MKKILLGLFLTFATGMLQADPLDDHVKVSGVVHAWDEGEIHRLSAKLYLPPRGQGALFLHLHDHKHRRKKNLQALKFFVQKKNGRSIFYIVFPYKTDDKIVVMRGTYTRDASVALYAGDIFVGPKKEGLELSPENTTACDDFTFKGMFSFRKRVPSREQ